MGACCDSEQSANIEKEIVLSKTPETSKPQTDDNKIYGNTETGTTEQPQKEPPKKEETVSNKNAKNCPGKHGLTQFTTPRSGYRCDGCRTSIPSATTMYGCRTCDYDLCAECYTGTKTAPPASTKTSVPPTKIPEPQAGANNAEEKEAPPIATLEIAEKKEAVMHSVPVAQIQEITEIDVIGLDKSGVKNISDAFTDDTAYLDLRKSSQFQFVLDLGKGSQLTSMEIKYHGRYSTTEITIFSSFTDDIDADWTQIGDLKLNVKPESDAAVTINNFIDYKNKRYIKVLFGGEFYSQSYINVDRFHFYGIAGVLRTDITDKIAVVDVSGVYNNDSAKYGVAQMFNDSNEYFETPKDDNHWLIFDLRGYIVSKIDIEFYSSSYTSDSVEFYHGIDLKNGFERIKEYDWEFKTELNRKKEKEPLPKQSITFDMTEAGTLIKHSRLLKMKFIHSEAHSAEITFFRIYGELGDAEYGEEKEAEFKYSWQEMEDEDVNEFEEEEDAIDVTQSQLIKILETYPKTEDKHRRGFKDMYRPEPHYYWESERVDNKKKDIWLKFDMGPIKIDSFDISLVENYHAGTVKVYTSKTNSAKDSDWSIIKIQRNIPKKESTKFYLKSDHARFLKLAVADRTEDRIEVNQLKWNGFEPVIEDEITNKMKIYQCSGKTDECQSVLKNNQDLWKSAACDPAWIIFDCNRYELDRLSITFAEKSKPETVKLRMSDVAPAYSFNIPSIMKWELNTCQTDGDDEWRNIELLEELSLSGKEYDKSGGFKRFIHLEFSTFQVNEMQINKIQFFGKLSENIAEDDEQFDSVLDAADMHTDDEKKQDNKAPYKPDFVDSSPAMQGYTTANIWKNEDHFFWMAQFGIPPFLILDLGNNQRFVDEILIKAYQYYPYKTLKVSTSNKAKAKEWDLLFEDNEMESKMNDGGTYDLSQYDVKQYIKMEFAELKLQMFAMASVKIYGDSDFFDKKEKVITWDHIKNMKHIDEDLIHEFREQEQKIVTNKMVTLMAQIQAVEKDENTGKLSEEWTRAKLEYYLNQSKFYYMFTELYAYQSATIYEQEQMMEVMAMQKEIATEEVKKILDYEVEYATNDKLKEEEEKKAKEAGEHRQHQKLVKERAEATTVYYTEFSKFFTNLSEKCYAMYSSEKDEKVYECWKEAIENHPRQISSLYNVQEYQQMQTYARKKDPDGFKKCWAVLADLFDESFEQEKELLHKFFVFQLSANYWEARSQSYGRPPVSILFDCASPIVGDDFSRKINRLEFKIPKPCNINRIVVSTAANIREEKLDSADADDDEKQIDWNNFNIIGQFQLSDELKTEKKENGLGYDDAKVMLDYKNERYVRVEFTEWDEGQTDLEIDRIRFFMMDDSDLKDEDEKDGGLQLAKYKLKLIDHNKTDKSDYRGIADAYKLSSSYYTTASDIKKPYLIFDCETRKIDQMEIRFDDTSWRQFDVINISTTDNYQLPDSDDAVDSKQDEDDWESIFEEEGQFKSYADSTNFKTVQIQSKNKRYLKLSFVLEAESTNLEIKHLKFHTIDPKDKYKWDIDQNIKNLTSQIKIIESTKSYSSQIAENVLAENSRKYRAAAYGVNHKESIEDRIRDKVCYGVNLLRKSRGGRISSHDKHFLKFLLCFQNERNYAEMLYSSKLVMNILRKPLDIEYKRLQSINSNILTLHVEEKDECKDISSMHSLLEWDYNKWYGARKAMFWPNDLKPLAEEWTKLGLRLTDPEFTQIRRKGMLETDRSFCSAEDLAMEYVNLIAYKLDPSFQKSMKNLFRQNREKLNLKFPTGNADIGVQSGPVKTKARQKIKIILKYFTKKPPQCMSVLDIVRCAIVCDDDVELCSLFELIMNTFSGQILRVKNAFDDVKKGDDSHGYRAVMINIAFGDEKVLPKGFRFVCEAQLLLNKYYQVRKNMHLGYGVCRSEDGGISQNKKPYYVLAQDSCKFGKLDI